MFKDSYVHDALSLKAIMTELSVVDGIRDMRKAPAPSNLLGSANAVDDTDDLQSRLRSMIDGMGTNSVGSAASVGSSEYESAYGTANLPYSSSDSDSSGEIRKRMERKQRKKKEERRKKEKGKKAHRLGRRAIKPGAGVKTPTQDGDCPHCVLHGRTSKHLWYSFGECYFNKKWKGWLPEWACEKMGKRFKKKKYFSVEMGGSLVELSGSESN